MSMKNISKALAMAVMMSAFCGNAYAYFQGGSAASAAGDGVAVGVANSENKGVAVGYYVSAAQNGVAIGNQINIPGVSAGKDSIAIGTAANAINQSAVAIGNGATASKDLGIALGSGATANGESAVALGVNSLAEGKNSVALGIASVASEDNTVSVGDSGSERRIVNVAAGENDTDAVNYSQIKAVDGKYVKADQTVAENFTALDNQVKTNADDISTLKSDVGALDTRVGTVEGDVSTLKTNVSALDTRVTAVEGFAGDISALQSDVANNKTDISNLKSDVATNKTDISKLKSDVANKANQADLNGEETARKDADANLQSQIDAIGSGSSAGMTELNNKINATNDRVDRVGATAAALAGIHYQPMAKGQSQVAVGMGGYKGKKATAIGMAYQFSDRVSGSVAGSANGSEHMFNVGFNYLFGQHTEKDIAQCAVAPGSMSLKEAELQATVDTQNAKINNLEAEVAELKAMVKALAAK